MSNPYTSGFTQPRRSYWIRATRQWLKKQYRLASSEIVGMAGVAPATLGQLSNHRQAPLWFCELMGALVAGWRPSRAWGDALPQERLNQVDALILGHPRGEELGRLYLPIAPQRWEDAVYEGRAKDVPVRCALLAEAILDGAVPCGLPFEEWEP